MTSFTTSLDIVPTNNGPTTYRGQYTMPKYLIEREVPGVGAFSDHELQAISRTSCDVLQALGPDIQWLHSYVTDDRLLCVYIAADEALVREHARCGKFPANRISEIRAGIDPTTGDGGQPSRTRAASAPVH
jgi:hypothetical protein